MAPRLLSCLGRRSSDSKHDNGDKVTEESTAEEHPRLGPVVIELFSSQGCATSTSAEMLLSRLGRGDFNLEVPLILLAYHVDYWDYMGWKDPFASTQWTVRQKAYVEALNLDTLFTPQFVIMGQAQCLASDDEALLSCIAAAPRLPAPTIQVSFERTTADSLQVSVKGGLRSKVDEGGNVMVALYESGLITNCGNGANKDRILANDYVVRRLEKLCPANKSISGTVNFSLWEGFNASKSGLAVFLENSSHHIFASQNFQLPHNL